MLFYNSVPTLTKSFVTGTLTGCKWQSFRSKKNLCKPSECINTIHKWECKCVLQICSTALYQINTATEPSSRMLKFNRCVCICLYRRDSRVMYLILCEDQACFLQRSVFLQINICEFRN